jgi:hypothetical protein
MDDDFRSAANARREGEVVGDVLALMRENNVPNREKRRFSANKAIAYIDLLPHTARTDSLRQELNAIVVERARITNAMLAEKANIERIKSSLGQLGYVSAQQIDAWASLIAGPVFQELAAAAQATGTEESLELRRSQENRYAYPIVSYEDLFVRKSPDGKFTEWFYWLNDVIVYQASEVNYREIGFYNLMMPLL